MILFFFSPLSWTFLYWCNGTGNWCWPPVPLEFCGSSGGLLWCSPPAPAHKRSLELKLLLGSCSTDACSLPISITPSNAEGRFTLDFLGTQGQNLALVFPVMGSSVLLLEGR